MSHTVCLRSHDARVVNEGTYQWTLQASNFSTTVAKAYLASIELPMSQWSIEEAWQRVYVTERLVVPANKRTLRVTEWFAAERTIADVMLPLHLNRIARLHTVGGGKVRIEAVDPHGLDAATFRWILEYEEHVKAIATAADVIDLSVAWAEGRVELTSANSLVVTPKTSASTLDAAGGYLHVPSPPTPAALAALLTGKLRDSPFGRRITVDFDASDCSFAVSLGAYPDADVTQTRLEVAGDDGLVALLGFGPQTSRVFTRRQLAPRTVGYAAATGRAFLEQHVVVPAHQATKEDTPPLTLRGDASALFGHAELRPGWYAPSQRIYSTSPPLRLQEEWELQFARLFFARAEEGAAELGIVFTDPFGVNRIAEILPGLYTPSSLVAYLQETMNVEANGYRFEVAFADGRFSFACSGGDDDNRVGLAFALHFSHRRSVDPAKLGFEAAFLEGSDRYESSTVLHDVVTPLGGALRNLYQISEVQGQRKFCIRPSAPPNVVGLVESYDASTRTLTLKCVTPTKRPVAHGMRRGAVVTLGASGYVETADGTRNESIPRGVVTSGVVLRGSESNGVVTMEVEVTPAPWIEEAVASTHCVSVAQQTEPCSFCFVPRLPKTVGGERLGFRPTTVQWGVDGAVRTRKLSVPPFLSTGVANLDHVDYVLLKLRECNRSTLIQSETGGHAMGVFGKVCLNPTFRHERHLPVEVSFAGGDRLDTLTIEVRNPDGTPYHFHEAAWSLSISFTGQRPKI